MRGEKSVPMSWRFLQGRRSQTTASLHFFAYSEQKLCQYGVCGFTMRRLTQPEITPRNRLCDNRFCRLLVISIQPRSNPQEKHPDFDLFLRSASQYLQWFAAMATPPQGSIARPAVPKSALIPGPESRQRRSTTLHCPSCEVAQMPGPTGLIREVRSATCEESRHVCFLDAAISTKAWRRASLPDASDPVSKSSQAETPDSTAQC